MLINFMFCNYKYKLRGSDMENYTKLSIKYLKFQKKRTILTILGVALASGILFVILTLYFSNFINTRDALRKQADYEMMDQIVITLDADDAVKAAVAKHADYIKSETLAVELKDGACENTYDLNGHKTGIQVERV